MTTRYDVAIIGTGAGGGTLAWALAATGKKILVLERGDYVPREKDNWSTRAVNREGKYNTNEAWRDTDGQALHPHTNYYVGGNTKFYGAALFRLRREDFGEIKHHGGISPAWPLSYEDMEPYYTAAERLYQVHGERGVDPTDPPASAPYPHPPVSHEPRIHEGLFARNLYLGQRIPLAGVAHQNGTIRFGRDPKTSALDANCKAHELDNLYVVDGSVFPSSAAVNPALTIIANALRVGEHVKERLA